MSVKKIASITSAYRSYGAAPSLDDTLTVRPIQGAANHTIHHEHSSDQKQRTKSRTVKQAAPVANTLDKEMRRAQYYLSN